MTLAREASGAPPLSALQRLVAGVHACACAWGDRRVCMARVFEGVAAGVLDKGQVRGEGAEQQYRLIRAPITSWLPHATAAVLLF